MSDVVVHLSEPLAVAAYRPPHGCGGCDARWTGVYMCHCTQCHITLGGVGPFDAHQINGKCLNVTASRNFYQSRPGVWSHQTDAARSGSTRAVKGREKAATAPKKGHS